MKVLPPYLVGYDVFYARNGQLPPYFTSHGRGLQISCTSLQTFTFTKYHIKQIEKNRSQLTSLNLGHRNRTLLNLILRVIVSYTRILNNDLGNQKDHYFKQKSIKNMNCKLLPLILEAVESNQEIVNLNKMFLFWLTELKTYARMDT